MYTDRPLPGLARPYIRTDLYARGQGCFDLVVWRCSGPGFVTAHDNEYYEALTLEEALDVVDAIYSAEHGAQPR